MLRHIVTDLAEHYVSEVLKPKLGSPAGQSTAEGPGKGGPDAGGGVNQGSDKKIRQAVYDIRYRARREEIPLQGAFTQYMANTSMNAMEKKAVREKLGLDRPGGGGAPAPSGGGERPGAAGPQKEEVELTEAPLQKFKVRVTDKESGKTYVRMATREKIAKLRSNPFISSVEMTKYGKTYEGGEDKPGKAKKDYDGDGKVESGAKEYRGVIHNKIQQSKGGKSDGKDTSNVKEGMSTDIENPNDLKNAVKKAVKRVDLNVSGDVDKNDKSMGNYGEFVPSADGKKKVVTKIDSVKEEFSNWREDLNSSEEDQNVDLIKEMPRGKKNKVKFNPEVAIESLVAEKGGEILEVKEVDLQEKGMSSDEMSSILKGNKYSKQQLLDMSKKSTKQGRHGEADALYKEFQKEEKKDDTYLEPDMKKRQKNNEKARKDMEKMGTPMKNPHFEEVEVEGYEPMTPAREKRVSRQSDKAYAKEVVAAHHGKGKEANKQMQRRIAMQDPAGRKVSLSKEEVDEKMNIATAKMGDVIKDFYKSDAPQFKGKTKEEIRKMAIAAKLEDERGIDEVTRYAKETGKDFKTGEPSAKPGTRPGNTFDKVKGQLRKTGGVISSRGKAIQPQGKKKEKGAKGYKGVTPVDKIKGDLARKRAPKPDPYGYGSGRYQGD